MSVAQYRLLLYFLLPHWTRNSRGLLPDVPLTSQSWSLREKLVGNLGSGFCCRQRAGESGPAPPSPALGINFFLFFGVPAACSILGVRAAQGAAAKLSSSLAGLGHELVCVPTACPAPSGRSELPVCVKDTRRAPRLKSSLRCFSLCKLRKWPGLGTVWDGHAGRELWPHPFEDASSKDF